MRNADMPPAPIAVPSELLCLGRTRCGRNDNEMISTCNSVKCIILRRFCCAYTQDATLHPVHVNTGRQLHSVSTCEAPILTSDGVISAWQPGQIKVFSPLSI